MIKIDSVSGFLGAGKTTFCNLLLKHYLKQNKRPVYIVNEFGRTGLDAELLHTDGFTSVSMEGGCICCTLKEDVVATMKMVIEQYNPTNIVFEPSGVFVFDNFFDIIKSGELSGYCEIGSVITIVDCLNFSASKAVYGGFIYNQIKNSPVLVLSKTAKASASVNEIICDLKNINPKAVVVSKPWEDFCDMDYELILTQKPEPCDEHSVHCHNHLKTVTMNLESSLTKKGLEKLSNCVRAGEFGDVYRAKGIVQSDGKPIVINIVGGEIAITDFRGVAETNLTFIGQSIDETALAAFLQNQ